MGAALLTRTNAITLLLCSAQEPHAHVDERQPALSCSGKPCLFALKHSLRRPWSRYVRYRTEHPTNVAIV